MRPAAEVRAEQLARQGAQLQAEQPLSQLQDASKMFFNVYFVLANMISFKITSFINWLFSSLYRVFLIEYTIDNKNDSNSAMVDGLVQTILHNKVQILAEKYYVLNDKNDIDSKNIIKGKIREISSGYYIFRYAGTFFFADVHLLDSYISRQTLLKKDTREKTIQLSTFRWNHGALIRMLNELGGNSTNRSTGPIEEADELADNPFASVFADKLSELTGSTALSVALKQMKAVSASSDTKSDYPTKAGKIYYNILGGSKWSNEPGKWIEFSEIIRRDMSTVILPEVIKSQICDDYEKFTNPETKTVYERIGMHYKRTYLLHGPPGTGKTSFIRSFASKYSLGIYEFKTLDNDRKPIDVNDMRINLNQIPPNSILLLEDVDVLFPNRQELNDTLGKMENSADKMYYMDKMRSYDTNMSSFFNLLDGIINTMRGCIIFMTTNYVDKLDSAILREGRCDMKVQFPHLDQDGVRKLFLTFYPDSQEEANIVSAMLGDKVIMPCELSEKLKHTYGIPMANVIEDVREKYMR